MSVYEKLKDVLMTFPPETQKRISGQPFDELHDEDDPFGALCDNLGDMSKRDAISAFTSILEICSESLAVTKELFRRQGRSSHSFLAGGATDMVVGLRHLSIPEGKLPKDHTKWSEENHMHFRKLLCVRAEEKLESMPREDLVATLIFGNDFADPLIDLPVDKLEEGQ
jgi:hypothetical protein